MCTGAHWNPATCGARQGDWRGRFAPALRASGRIGPPQQSSDRSRVAAMQPLDNRLRALGAYLTESLYKIILFRMSIFPQKFVNSFFISVIIKDKLTDLCGNRHSQNNVMNTFCETRACIDRKALRNDPPVFFRGESENCSVRRHVQRGTTRKIPSLASQLALEDRQLTGNLAKVFRHLTIFKRVSWST